VTTERKGPEFVEERSRNENVKKEESGKRWKTVKPIEKPR
jgi:hypothetical protein